MARARHSRELPVAHKLCQAATSACAICLLCMYLVAHKLCHLYIVCHQIHAESTWAMCHLYMGHVPSLHVPCATFACIRFRTSCAKNATSTWACATSVCATSACIRFHTSCAKSAIPTWACASWVGKVAQKLCPI